MDNNELTIYILQQLRQGVPEQSIRAVLGQNGWPQPLIDRAFSMVQQAAPHNVPANVANDTQPNYGMPEAELPNPGVTAANPEPLPAPTEPQMQMPKKERGNGLRVVLVSLLVLILLAGIGFGGFLVYKAIKDHKSKAPTTSQTSKTDPDATRKHDIDTIATDLQVYYKAYHSYPTLSDVNSQSFASAKNGFDQSKFKDPDWDAKKSACSDQGRVIFADSRTDTCYSYRVTAMNGDDCDASSKPCVRVVLTANLKNNKPYIVALDENIKE